MLKIGITKPIRKRAPKRVAFPMVLRDRIPGGRDERGAIGMMELLTTAALTVVLVGTIGILLVVSARQQPRISDRAASIQEGRALVEQFTRELREGFAVQATPTASSVTFRTYVRRSSCGSSASLSPSQPAIACRVTYSCASGTCTRTENPISGAQTGQPVTMVTGLASSDVFSYLPSASSPDHVGVTLVFPALAGDDDAITITDGADLRNQ
jgi:Tfp pilus assembly protein PilW